MHDAIKAYMAAYGKMIADAMRQDRPAREVAEMCAAYRDLDDFACAYAKWVGPDAATASSGPATIR